MAYTPNNLPKNITLVRGVDLTGSQKNKLTFNGMKSKAFIECNSFYFDGLEPAQGDYLYPVTTSFSDLRY